MTHENTNKKSLLKSGLSLSVLTLMSRILGLIREMTKAAFLGTSDLSDAFTFAFQAPNLFRKLFAENSISVAFIPTFKKYLEKENSADEASVSLQKTETQQFLNATFTLITFLTTVLTVCGIIAAPFITPFFTKSTDPSIPMEMSFLTRLMFPYLIVISAAAFFQGILNGFKVFSPSGFTPVLFNLSVIVFTYLLSPVMKNSARAMAVGVIIGGTIQAAFQVPFVLRCGKQIRFTSIKNAFTNPGTIKVIKLVGPTIFGMAAYSLNDLVSVALAGRAGVGIQSSLQYSLRLQELILGIFAVSIGTVILPDLTGMAAQNNQKRFNELLLDALKIVILISIPVTFFSQITGENIIRLVFQSRSFDEQSVALTLNAFRFHIAGLVFIAMNRIIAPAFYAKGNTKDPSLAGIICFISNMIFAFVLVKPMKGGGIALALSLASLVNTIVLFIFMKKEKTADISMLLKSTLFYLLKIILLSVIASAPLVIFKEKIFSLFSGSSRIISQGIPLVICTLIFFTIGVLLLILTKDKLIISVKNMLTGRKSKK